MENPRTGRKLLVHGDKGVIAGEDHRSIQPSEVHLQYKAFADDQCSMRSACRIDFLCFIKS